jgi:uncharacterized membrane protein YqhA
MSQLSNAIESILFRARFLLAPLYLGLVGALILLTYLPLPYRVLSHCHTYRGCDAAKLHP